VLSFTPKLRREILTFALVHTVVNTGFRMVYPFLPAISRGLGVPLETVALAITVRSLIGLASPLLGSVADFRGRKNAILLSLLVVALGLGLIALWPSLAVFYLGLSLSAIGRMMFDPSARAYLGDAVAYHRRGLAIAVTEFGWSGAYLIGMPIIGWLIAVGNWRSPFPWLAGLTLACAAGMQALLPDGTTAGSQNHGLRRTLGRVLSSPSALGGIGVGFTISFGAEVISIVYAAWLEGTFAFQVTALGATGILIGVAELGGEGLVATLSDRFGKRRSVALGAGLTALAALALPLAGRNLQGALIGLFAFFIAFEFAIVSSIPMLTELVPSARATSMAVFAAGNAAGHALGALIGPRAFQVGLYANSALAAGLNLTAILLLYRFVQEDAHSPESSKG
jgi:predicted MFS family arabinose efflux permease